MVYVFIQTGYIHWGVIQVAEKDGDHGSCWNFHVFGRWLRSQLPFNGFLYNLQDVIVCVNIPGNPFAKTEFGLGLKL